MDLLSKLISQDIQKLFVDIDILSSQDGGQIRDLTMTDLFSNDTTVQPESAPIAGFFGEFRFLSNFWPAEVEFEGAVYPSVENAYQAAKTTQDSRAPFLTCTASKSKFLGKGVVIRADWNAVKIQVMQGLVAQKFAAGKPLSQKLLDTNDRLIIESNTWGDRFWGQCDGKGHNHLGRLLMLQRSELTKRLFPAP